MTLSYYFTKPSTENTQLWWKSVLSNKLSRIKISELIPFLTENENLIKQPPDATSSSDSDPDFSLSPRHQTFGLRPFRGPKPRTLISPPTRKSTVSLSIFKLLFSQELRDEEHPVTLSTTEKPYTLQETGDDEIKLRIQRT
ncbi:hypothetical protein AVEN_120357-1, partial [Araneus ventricosus]